MEKSLGDIEYQEELCIFELETPFIKISQITNRSYNIFVEISWVQTDSKVTVRQVLSHSVAVLQSNLEIIPCFSIDLISFSNFSFKETGTLYASFWTGTASSVSCIFTGAIGNLTMLEKIDLNFFPFTSVSLFRIVPLFVSQLSNGNHVSSPSHYLDTLK